VRTQLVQGIPIAYREVGEGTPLLLIHGWQGDHRYMMADLEPVFDDEPGAGRWRRIYIDLPGHGRTPAPSWLGAQHQVISVLRDLIDALIGPTRFAVAGNSYGGYLSLALVRSLPSQLLGAALLVPDLPDEHGDRNAPAPQTLIHAPDAFADLSPDEGWIPAALVEQSPLALEQIRAHDMPSIRDADQKYLSRLNQHYLLPTALARPGAAFARPSLILTGRQDATVGYRAAWGLLDELPRATYATLDLAGHWLGRVERPGPFHTLVRDWLERMVAWEPQ
jgi:pimeloyl-ACP methyl ester carboxylesterase